MLWFNIAINNCYIGCSSYKYCTINNISFINPNRFRIIADPSRLRLPSPVVPPSPIPSPWTPQLIAAEVHIGSKGTRVFCKRELEYRIPRLRSHANSRRRFPEISVRTKQASCRYSWKTLFLPYPVLKSSLVLARAERPDVDGGVEARS